MSCELSPERLRLSRQENPMKRHVLCLLTLAMAGAAQGAPSRGPIEHNKSAARRLFESSLSTGNWEEYLRLHTRDFKAHAGGRSATLEEDLTAAKELRKAFPDLRVRVLRVVAENDMVVVQWLARGVNTGAGNGLPATGRSVEVGGITIFRMKDGLIAEEWNSMDTLLMLRQLGLMPSP